MGLETAAFIANLVAANPLGSDQKSQGDNHLRLIKSALQATFPNATKAFYFPTTSAILTVDTAVALTHHNRVFAINATAAPKIVTAPPTDVPDGFTFVVMKTDSSVNSVEVAAAAQINGAEEVVLRQQFDSAILTYNTNSGTWYAQMNTTRLGVARTVLENTAVTLADLAGYIVVNAAGGETTVTFSSAVPAGFRTKVRKNDASENAVVLNFASAGNLNGAGTRNLTTQYEELEVFFNGTTWYAEPASASNTASLGKFDTVGFRYFESASGEYTPTPGTKFIIGMLLAGGGGGGGATGTNPTAASGGGGGAGAFMWIMQDISAVEDPIPYVIGQGGDGGAASGANGEDGEDSVFNTFFTALGGQGGRGRTTTGGGAGGSGGLASTGSSENLGVAGGDGVTGSGTPIGGGGGDGRGVVGGHGGASFFGGGASGVYIPSGFVSAEGKNAQAYGSGGSGAACANTATGAAGGDGRAGILIIFEFISTPAEEE